MSSSLSLMSYIPSSSHRPLRDKRNNQKLVIHKEPFAGGGYSSIFKCEYNGEHLVAKKIALAKDGFVDQPFEPLIMGCGIPFINRYRDVVFEEEYMYIIQNPGKSMKEYRRSDIPSYEESLRWFMMLLTALKYLHRYNIVHLDIKPDNTLIFENEIHLSDLGLACIVQGSYERHVGTASYRPPEVWFNQTKTTKSDVWSLGLAIYYLINGEDLFSSSFSDKAMRNLEYKKFIEQWTKDYTEGNKKLFHMNPRYPLAQVIFSMLHPNPNLRPTCSQLLKNPIFKNVSIPKKHPKKISIKRSPELLHVDWIYSLLEDKFTTPKQGYDFSKWFIHKNFNGHHISPIESEIKTFHLLERRLISNATFLPKTAGDTS
jgi:serine/threonine protein kinase